jgi:hypothetical protein
MRSVRDARQCRDRADDLGGFDEACVVEGGELEQFAAVVVDDVAPSRS